MSVTSLDVKQGGKKDGCPLVESFVERCNRLEAEGYDEDFILKALELYAQVCSAQSGAVIEYV